MLPRRFGGNRGLPHSKALKAGVLASAMPRMVQILLAGDNNRRLSGFAQQLLMNQAKQARPSTNDSDYFHISSLSKSVHLNAHADQLKLATLSKVLVYDVLDATGREPACSHMGLRGQARPTQARIISILSST